jgi:protein transport protein SEC61 subunit gamma-like protein
MAIEIVESFIQRSMRVLRVSYRPKSDEFWMIAKITGLGMLLIGLTGFLITVIFTFISSVKF